VRPDLAILGVGAGEAVRWRTAPRGRWRYGTVTHRERDGSVGVHDPEGGARSLPVDVVEVRRRGRGGAAGWEPLTVRAARSEQLRLQL
jgi:hypothetical protein